MEVTDSYIGTCPWENRSELGIVKAYWATLKEVLLNTKACFTGVPGPHMYWDSALFAITSLVIGFLGVQLLAEVKDWAITDVRHQQSLRAQMIALDMKLLPVLSRATSTPLVMVLLQVTACQLKLIRRTPQYQGLAATWAVFFYSLGAREVLYIVPFVGDAFAVAWMPIVLAVGLATVHRTDLRNAIVGVLVIVVIGTFFKTAVSILGLVLNMEPCPTWGQIARFILRTL